MDPMARRTTATPIALNGYRRGVRPAARRTGRSTAMPPTRRTSGRCPILHNSSPTPVATAGMRPRRRSGRLIAVASVAAS